MPQSATPVAPEAKSALLKDLEGALRQSWTWVLLFVIAGLLVAILSLRDSNYSYPVEMQLTSVQSNTQSSNGGGAGALSQLSGLASLANLSLPTNQNAMQFQLFVDSLFTRDLADDIAKNQDVMIKLFGDQWDATTHAWHEPTQGALTNGILAVRNLFGLAPANPWHAPDGENVQSFLSQNLVVTQDPRKSYLVTLTLTSSDRVFAARFLNLLTGTADNRLRQRALLRARNYINYLTYELSKVTIAEHRAALTEAMGEQERYAMVASSSTPFAAEIFQSPWASNLPASPSPRQVFLFWAGLGAVIGMGLAFLRYRYGESIVHLRRRGLRH